VEAVVSKLNECRNELEGRGLRLRDGAKLISQSPRLRCGAEEDGQQPARDGLPGAGLLVEAVGKALQLVECIEEVRL
jgi:hypothetical protein